MINTESIQIKWKSDRRRNGVNAVIMGIGIFLFALVLIILGSIIEYVSAGGISHISIGVLTGDRPFIFGYGIANAIIGTWELVAIGLVFSIPPGILGSIYLVRSRSNGKISSTMKLFTDILTSVPSIVIGLFGYLVLVVDLKLGFSLIAGGFALSAMMLPYVMRVSELSMRAVQKEQVQNAYALGADDVQVARRIYLPQAFTGIMSGIILAISIAAGETAQLLYTAEWNGRLPTGLTNSSVGYLTYVVVNGLNYVTQSTHNLAFVAAFVLIITILGLTLISHTMVYIIRFFKRVGKWFVRVFS